ncbi:MAG: hypothetical protein CL846_00830 [Crocinitomicaceae bacterium]|nr:hypothetical protein [Crocinitomicaceae bacterium]|tara:strand:+ start:10580 stop:11590 length:1011 start_codon:yes stop_codon:yes gene_type:complete
MPAIKNALLRYRVIDRALRNNFNPFPSKEQLRQSCEEEIFGSLEGEHICHSTIEKDLFAMRMEHDAPIVYSKKERGYYYSDDEYSLEDVPLTEKDISAIKAASTIFQQFKSTSLFGQYEFAINKILDRAVLSKESSSNNEDEVIQFEAQPTVRGNEHLEPLLSSIKSKTSIQFNYYNFIKNEHTVRRVHPYLLKEYRNRWYLIGKSELKNKIITFGLDRISDIIKLEKPFLVDSDFSADNFFKHSIGITVYDQLPQKIVIEVNNILAKYLETQPLHHSQVFEKINKNGSHVFSYFLLSTYELKMQLLGFGRDVKVLEPKELKEEIIENAREIIKQY